MQTKYPLHSENRVYDIYEQYPDGTKQWRSTAIGMEKTESRLRELAKDTPNNLVALSVTDSKLPQIQLQASAARLLSYALTKWKKEHATRV
jgi:hypothetical protein